MIKILHTADWHIRDGDIDEIEKCLEFLIKTAKDERPDLIIHAGDLYDSQDVKTDSKATKLLFRAISDLANISPTIAIIGTPSHDGHAAEVLRYIDAKYPVHVATIPEQIYLYEDGAIETAPYNRMGGPLKAIISLIPAPTKQFFKTNSDIKGADAEIAQAMNGLFAGFGASALGYGVPHVLVGHWNVTGSLISETQTLTGVDIELSKDQMFLAAADLVCLGHIHMHQKINPNIFFAGSIYRNNYGEMDEKGFYIHTIDTEDGNRLDSDFFNTPTRKLAKLDADLTDKNALPIENMDLILHALKASTSDPDEIKDSDLRLNFKVYQDEAQKIDKKQIEEFYLSAGAKSVDVRIVRIPRENVRSKTILKLKTLREKIIENADLKKETVPQSVLDKADQLEAFAHEQIIYDITKGGEADEKLAAAS